MCIISIEEIEYCIKIRYSCTGSSIILLLDVIKF